MNWRIWGKRVAAFSVAVLCVTYAWHVYKDQFWAQSDAEKEVKRLKAQQRVARVAPPSTRPATRPRRTFAARVEPASTQRGEVAGRDPYHPHDPKDPFLIARATRHIDGPTDTARAGTNDCGSSRINAPVEWRMDRARSESRLRQQSTSAPFEIARSFFSASKLTIRQRLRHK